MLRLRCYKVTLSVVSTIVFIMLVAETVTKTFTTQIHSDIVQVVFPSVIFIYLFIWDPFAVVISIFPS